MGKVTVGRRKHGEGALAMSTPRTGSTTCFPQVADAGLASVLIIRCFPSCVASSGTLRCTDYGLLRKPLPLVTLSGPGQLTATLPTLSSLLRIVAPWRRITARMRASPVRTTPWGDGTSNYRQVASHGRCWLLFGCIVVDRAARLGFGLPQVFFPRVLPQFLFLSFPRSPIKRVALTDVFLRQERGGMVARVQSVRVVCRCMYEMVTL